MANPVRWGIMGTGNIARQFTAGMANCRRGQIVAVGSRTREAAEGFATQFKVQAAHPTYESLLADRNVDAIYLSLPNSLHHEWSIKALRAGKHVLCEKPIAVNASQAQEMFDIAQKSGKVLVEAFMYRAHPQTRAIMETIKSGAIGDVKIVKTSFCYRTTKVDENIRFDPALAGGAMMDIGCYCLSFARMIAGAEPTRILATGRMHPCGVDEAAAGTLHFPGDILASFVCGMTTQADNTAFICGTEGYLAIGWPWKPQRKASFTIAHSAPPKQDAKGAAGSPRPPEETVSVEAEGELYALEGDSVAATIQDNAPPMMSPDDTLGNMRALDEVRRQISAR